MGRAEYWAEQVFRDGVEKGLGMFYVAGDGDDGGQGMGLRMGIGLVMGLGLEDEARDRVANRAGIRAGNGASSLLEWGCVCDRNGI